MSANFTARWVTLRARKKSGKPENIVDKITFFCRRAQHMQHNKRLKRALSALRQLRQAVALGLVNSYYALP